MKHLLRFVALLALSAAACADSIGDFAPGATAICGQYTTYNPSTGAPATLAGTPALAVYKIGDGVNSATESTTGLTHAEDVDARTGLNRVCIDTSADGTFYSAGAQFSVVITTGTVNSVSVVGSEVKNFSLNKTSPLKPATAGRPLTVSAGGAADSNQVSIAGTSITTLTGAYPSLGIIDSGTAQAATGTTLQLRSAATFADSEIIGATCLITGGTTGIGQARTVTAYTGSTDTATVATWTTTPTGTITYVCFGTASASSIATDVWSAGSRTLTAATNITSTGGTIPITASRVDASVGAYQSGQVPLQPTVAGRTLDVSTTGEAGVDWANVGSPSSSVTLSNTTVSTGQVVASVTGATGSVGAGGITAASFATDAITAAKVAADVTPEIQSGLATQSSLTTVGNNVTSLQAAVAALNNLSSTQVRDIMIEDQGGGITLGCAIAAITAYVTGDLSTTGGNSTYKDPSGTENRITGIVSSPGNRLGTITCPTYP